MGLLTPLGLGGCGAPTAAAASSGRRRAARPRHCATTHAGAHEPEQGRRPQQPPPTAPTAAGGALLPRGADGPSWWRRCEPCAANGFDLEHVRLLDAAFERATGRGLLQYYGIKGGGGGYGGEDDDDDDGTASLSSSAARRLYEEVPFCLLSHSTPPPPARAEEGGEEPREPLLDYGNQAAQQLFEYAWSELLGTPSRLTAETAREQAEREAFLERVRRDGFVTDYSGVRVARSGRRFEIKSAVVWNLHDPATGALVGQAAAFRDWEALPVAGQ
mmetsp:Transcript_2615/g.9489  ORF Transcript_2615/g.9489 Transcript_2615/m.9489 type:complete len:274 (+) Transcript_2615:426-1247(+)